MRRIIVVCESDDLHERVLTTLAESQPAGIEIESLPLAAARERIETNSPDLVILEVPDDEVRLRPVLELMPREEPQGIAEHILATCPAICAIVIGKSDAKLILKCIRMGAAEYVDGDEIESELPQAISNARSKGSCRVVSVFGNSITQFDQRILAVAGKLAGFAGSCAILDMRSEGDSSATLRSDGGGRFDDLCRELDTADAENRASFFSRRDGEVYVLDCRSLTVQSSLVPRILELTRARFPHTIVLLNQEAAPSLSAVLKHSDLIALVLLPDAHTMRNTRWFLGHIESLGADLRRRVVLVTDFRGSGGHCLTL